jgi:hypothetical protein
LDISEGASALISEKKRNGKGSQPTTIGRS